MECAECARGDPTWSTFSAGCDGCIKRELRQMPFTMRRALKIAPSQATADVIEAMILVRHALAIAGLKTKEEVSAALREFFDRNGKIAADRLKAEVVYLRQQMQERSSESGKIAG